MAYEKTTSGKNWATDFPGVTLPAGLTEENDGNATITVAGGLLTIDSPGPNAWYGYVVSDAVDAACKVIRTKVTYPGSGATNHNPFFASIWEDTVQPSGALAFNDAKNVRPGYCGNQESVSGPAMWAMNGWGTYLINQVVAAGTYIFEILWDVPGAGSATLNLLDPTTLAVLHTGNGVRAKANNQYLLLGDISTTINLGVGDIDWWNVAMMESRSVTITDIEDGYVVKLYDASDNLKATSAAAAGGSAVMDCALVDFGGDGFTGYFKVFNGAVEDRRLPAAGNFTEEALYGGDEWPGVLPGPTITSITPDEEQVGDPVTIAGTGYGAAQGASTVTFDGVDAGTAISWSDTEIIINVPVGATTGDVIVTVDGLPSPGEPFTVLGDPAIILLDPDYGWIGDRVTITGTNFGAAQGAASVEFNGVTATITSWSDTEIVCRVPVGATDGNVVIRNV